MWLWMGVVYHWLYFTLINPAAWFFGALFVAQAGLLVWFGNYRRELIFGWPGGWRGTAGGVLVTYSALVYPLLNQIAGHDYPRTPTFGLPCPTTIFTLGMFCWLKVPYPRVVMVIPLLWTIIGGSAAFILDVPADLALPVAGLTALAVYLTTRTEVGL